MRVQLADRARTVKEYYFSQKLASIRKMTGKGIDVINMGIGSPDIPPPAEVVEELMNVSGKEDVHGYQPYLGTGRLRMAIAGWYKRFYDVTLDPETQILPLMGSKEGVMHISMAYLNRGDAVLVPDPGYPAYAAAAGMCGARCVYYDLDKNNRWLPDLDSLKKEDLNGVKMMWINYPNMPTGSVASLSDFKNIVDFAKQHNILVVNDNPYSFLLNNNKVSLLAADYSHEAVLELNSLSKSHNMAGWRMGMLVGHADYIRDVLKVKSNMDSGMFLPIQEAAVKALNLNGSWYEDLNDIYGRRQELVLELMSLLGCRPETGSSGMFVWSEIPPDFINSYEFSDYCLEKYNLFITPGLVFGSNGHRYVRTSLCVNDNRIKEAINRIKTKKI
ncbi:MAG: aminotransferase class I/II-fold pyridoxal phosphate-dependent enzyme [Bacteroidales bacterium]|nr:aminotransferase class I/II-fold pyridoxal phosphate-dependent enzyme [Bacteroidales bacterium]